MGATCQPQKQKEKKEIEKGKGWMGWNFRKLKHSK